MAALASVLALSGLLVISTHAARKLRPEVGSCRGLRADAKLSRRTVGDHGTFKDAALGDPLEEFGDGQKSDRETAKALGDTCRKLGAMPPRPYRAYW
jgi:hypothetical protein